MPTTGSILSMLPMRCRNSSTTPRVSSTVAITRGVTNITSSDLLESQLWVPNNPPNMGTVDNSGKPLVPWVPDSTNNPLSNIVSPLATMTVVCWEFCEMFGFGLVLSAFGKALLFCC